MKQILLIAWREYRQYVFSRGFLIFLLIFPIGFTAISGAVDIIERSKPVRAFIVYDETGKYADALDKELEVRFLRSTVMAWDIYVSTYADPGRIAEAELLSPFAHSQVSLERMEAFQAEGGAQAANAFIQPYLTAARAPAFSPPARSYVRAPLPDELAADAGLDEAEKILRPYLLGETPLRNVTATDQLFAAIFIPKTFGESEGGEPAQYWSRNLTDNSLQEIAASALSRALREDAAQAFGLQPAEFDELSSIAAPLNAFRPDRSEEEARLGLRDRVETILPAAMTYMLLIIIFGAGNLLLTNTIEERSNKIVEVLLSSVTADQLMMGKLVGIAAVGLTMPTVFLVGGAAAGFFVAGDEGVMNVVLSYLFSSPLILIYLFYFFCAYTIFSMVFLAIGAMSNSLQDAQSYMGPLMLLVFAPLPFMIIVFQNPNGAVASALTWIPIYTPYAVLMRAASDPPLWEVVGATLLMLLFAFFLARYMGRIFRNAILQASPPKARDVLRLSRKESA